jgi:hypothetical protein
MKKLVIAALFVAACGPSSSSNPEGSSAALSGKRKIVTRTLNPYSAQNLIKDPFVGPDEADWADFQGFYDNDFADWLNSLLPLHRTLESVSPVGGFGSIEHLASAPDPTKGPETVLENFMGGPGNFAASIWISVADAQGNPKHWADVSASVSAAVLDQSGQTSTAMVVSSAGEVTYGARPWVQLVTKGDLAIPAGGYLEVHTADPTLEILMTAPQVTSSTLGGPSGTGEKAALAPWTATEHMHVMHFAQREKQKHRRTHI